MRGEGVEQQLPDRGVDGAAGDGLAALRTVLDAAGHALVVGDFDAAAGVVAHRHPAAAAPADCQALQQRGSFAGGAGGAIGAVRTALVPQPMPVAADRHGPPSVPKSVWSWSWFQSRRPLYVVPVAGRDPQEGVLDWLAKGWRGTGEFDNDFVNFLELSRRDSEIMADVSGRLAEIGATGNHRARIRLRRRVRIRLRRRVRIRLRRSLG